MAFQRQPPMTLSSRATGKSDPSAPGSTSSCAIRGTWRSRLCFLRSQGACPPTTLLIRRFLVGTKGHEGTPPSLHLGRRPERTTACRSRALASTPLRALAAAALPGPFAHAIIAPCSPPLRRSPAPLSAARPPPIRRHFLMRRPLPGPGTPPAGEAGGGDERPNGIGPGRGRVGSVPPGRGGGRWPSDSEVEGGGGWRERGKVTGGGDAERKKGGGRREERDAVFGGGGRNKACFRPFAVD